MILARMDDDWYLAAFGPHIRGCNLSTNQVPTGRHAHHFHVWKNHIYVWSHAPLGGITFYPTLRYRGIPVSVFHGWHPDSEEPLLSLLMGRPRVSLDEPDDLVRQRWERLLEEGWEDGGRDGMAGYVHVNDPDLEKIEGPPLE